VAKPPSGSPKKRGGCLRSVILLLAALGLTLVLSRDAVATWVVHRAIAQQGVECRDLKAEVALSFQTIHLLPVSCDLPDAVVVSRLSFPEGATIEWSGWTPTRVSTPRVETSVAANMQHAALRLSQLGALVASVHGGSTPLPERMRGYVDKLAELSRDDGPRVEVARLLVTVVPGTQLEIGDLAFGVQQGTLSAEAAALPLPVGRMGLLRVAEVTVRSRIVQPRITASSSAVSISGTVEIEGSVVGRQLRRAAPFRVTATGLDTDSPRYLLGAEPLSR